MNGKSRIAAWGVSLWACGAAAWLAGCAVTAGGAESVAEERAAMSVVRPQPTAVPVQGPLATPLQGPLLNAPGVTAPGASGPLKGSCDLVPHKYVLRLPDKDGAPKYGDGYTVPFPTPWAQATADALGAPYTDVPKYEALLATVPGVNGYEYLVHEVQMLNGEIKIEDTHDYFLVGITDPTQAKLAMTYASQYPAKPVEAQIFTCVHVIERVPGSNTIVEISAPPTVFPVADVHDPSTHPNQEP